MEQAKIRLSDINPIATPVERLRDLDGLVSSIRNSGLREPLLIAEKDHALLSGARRFEACSQANVIFVDAFFARDIEEGSRELQRHLENLDPLYSLPMTVTEKVTAAFSLHRLPAPAGAENSFRRDLPAATAVGLHPKVYALLRSTLRKAEKEESSPPGTAITAQKSLLLMVEAVESSTLDYPVTSVVTKLHQLLRQGICPDTLESCFPYLSSKPGAKNDSPDRTDSAGSSVPRVRSPRRYYDYVRTADVVIGTLEGLSDIITADLAKSEHFEYMLKALKDARRTAHSYVRKMEKMRNG
ncbi:ParB N-terminal domain-containing protein [Streptomyces sp. NPDC051642]|uniref:ParB N-terminal domain-containing protein n=1 Tax=Streptomyces sp. NPDC051642 TaxID=3154646 RepID=UPI00343C2A49